MARAVSCTFAAELVRSLRVPRRTILMRARYSARADATARAMHCARIKLAAGQGAGDGALGAHLVDLTALCAHLDAHLTPG